MRSIGLALASAAAVACTILHVSSAAASPSQPPAIPWNLPAIPSTVPGLPNLAPQLQQLQQAVASCPTVEVAPNVRIPVCVNGGIPTPPAGTLIPEAWLPSIPIAPAVDLRTRGLDGPVMNQQQTGVCYAFALSDVLDNSLRRQGRVDSLSPLHVIVSNSYEDMFGETRPEPLASEGAWPYDPIEACKLKQSKDVCESTYGVTSGSWRSDPHVVIERARARSIGYATAQKATRIAKANAPDGIAHAIASGRAVLLNIGIDTNAWGFSNVRDGRLRDYEVADRGAHSVAVVAYRTTVTGREFLLHNSWGATWGDNGYVWVTEAGLRKHFVEAYLVEATVGAPQPPAPTPARPPLWSER